MIRFQLRLFTIVVIFIIVIVDGPIRLRAQVPDPGIAAQAPVPGSGHHYIGIGAETVNPADGSLTFDLPIQLPTGRGISMTFGIRYSANEQYFPTNQGWGSPGNGGSSIGWQSLWAGGYSDIQVGSWSYTVPMLATRIATLINQYSAQPQGTPCPNGITTGDGGSGQVMCPFTCFGNNSVVFRGLNGTQYSLPIADIYPNPANWSGLGNVCPTPNSIVTPGNAHGILSTVNTNSQSGAVDGATVVDQSGTTYQFPSWGGGQSQPYEYAATASPPTTITDRNGNQMTVGSTTLPNGRPGTTFIDPTSRQAVAYSGPGVDGDQIKVSGLGAPVTVHWTNTNVTFPENYQVSSGSSACTLHNTLTGVTQLSGYSVPTYSIPVMSSIVLPNGQSYSFTYEGTSGKISKITFPDGGYVRYVWGVNPFSQSTNVSWEVPPSDGYAGGPASCTIAFDTPAITDRYVSFNGTTEVLHQQFCYTTNWGSGSTPCHQPTLSGSFTWTSKTTVVTTTDSVTGLVSKTTYSYGSASPDSTPYGGGFVSQVPVETNVLYQDGSGNTYKAENKTWGNPNLLIADQTILYSNGAATVGSATGRCYNSDEQATNVYEYGFTTDPTNQNQSSGICSSTGVSSISGLNSTYIGPLRRQTTTAYQPFYTCCGTHIVNAPSQITVADGSGTTAKSTVLSYPNPSQEAFQTSGAINLTLSRPASTGDITLVQELISGSTFATTKYSYYDTGQVYTKTDPCKYTTCTDMSGSGLPSTYSYADAYASGTGTPPGQTSAYLTQMTDPLGFNDNFTWGYNDGLIRSHKDPNNQTTTFAYADPNNLDRLTQIVDADGGQTFVGYNDAAPNPSMTVCKLMNTTSSVNACPVSGAPAGNWTVATSVRDGMGHTVQTQHSDPVGSVLENTNYTGLGQVYQQANPTRCTSSPGAFPSSCPETTWGYTQFAYDVLGRKTLLTHSPDASTESWAYSGPIVTFTDENRNAWTRTSDGIGRLIQVKEPNLANTYYNYDTLDDLTCAAQDGGNGGTPSPTCQYSATWRPRSFTYDNLAHLLSATNPESGTTHYAYDYNGNVTTKTDARGVVVSYTYDPLNRVVGKTYSDSATPNSCYQYGTATSCNLARRLINEWTAPTGGSCPASAPSSGFLTMHSLTCYDAVGRLTTASQRHCIGTTCSAPSPYSLTMAYDLMGNLNTLTNSVGANGSPLTLLNYFDVAARPCLTTSSWTMPNTSSQPTGPANLFQTSSLTTTNNIGYAATGALQNWYLGSTSSTASTGCSTNPSTVIPGNLQQVTWPRLWVTSFSAIGQVP